MNNPDNIGEPSMDEILASIRKIIAEEPSDARAEPEANANPLLTGTALGQDRSERSFHLNDRPRPSLDRLSNALKARAITPPAPPPVGKPSPFYIEPSSERPSTFGTKPASSFEDDLAELLDVPLPANPLSSNVLTPNPLAGMSGFNGAEPIAVVSRAEAKEIVVEALDSSLLDETEDDIPAAATSDETATIATTAMNGHAANAPSAAEYVADAAPPAPQPKPELDSPWESMRRKNGFWPPQPAASKPAAPAVASDSIAPGAALNGSFAPGSGPFPSKEAQKAHNASAPTTTADLIARLQAGLNETETPPEQAPPANLQFGVPLGAGVSAPATAYGPAPHAPHTNGAYANGPATTNGAAYAPAPPPSNFTPPFAAPRPPDPQPEPQTPAPDPYARPLSTDAMMNAALASLMSVGVSPPPLDPFTRPQPPAEPPASQYQGQGHYAQSAYPPSSYPPNTYPAHGPDPTVAAAAAFDALAHGLSGTPRPEPRRTYEYHPAAPTPSHAALVVQPLLPVVQEVHPQAVRTLEDAVAEMLKPMLQRWLADNMPRIIERALRVEAASGMKPPGSQ